MPWKESRVVDERLCFIAACSESEESFAGLCRRFGISRRVGYKWLDRYDELGPVGLLDRPPVARVHPAQTPAAVVDVLLTARKEQPSWGPRKLRDWLGEQNTSQRWPAPSTIGEILKGHGLIRPPRRRPRVPPGAPLERGVAPNDVWCADFKGHFRLGNKT